jgi:hypothetical protein
MTRNNNDVSLLTWGPLPPQPQGAQPKYILLRKLFSAPRAVLEVPTHHKILCGGVVVHGRTVVLSSYPDDGSSGGDGTDKDPPRSTDPAEMASHGAAQHSAQRWVVHHRPLTAAARVEALVVAVFDPDDLLDVQIRKTSWGQVCIETPSSSHLYRWDLEEQHQRTRPAGRCFSTQQITSLLVAQVNCAKVEDSARTESHSANNTTGNNPWMLVGGGFLSEHPVVSCGPEWRRVWRVAAPPHDALSAFSISIRMSSAFLASKHYAQWSERLEQHQGRRAHSGLSPIRHVLHHHNSDSTNDDDEGSIRFESAVQSCAPSGPPSPLSMTRRTPHLPPAASGGVDLNVVAAALVVQRRQRSTSNSSSIDFDENTDDTADGRAVARAPVIYDSIARYSATPSMSSSRIRSSTTSPHSRHAHPPPHSPLHPLIHVSLGDAVRSTTGSLSSRGGGAGGGGDRSGGCGGEWSVTLPEPFGMMCALFRGCTRQDNVALHAMCSRAIALQHLQQQPSSAMKNSGGIGTATPRRAGAAMPRAAGASPLAQLGNQSNVAVLSADPLAGVKPRTRALWQK